MKLTKLSNLMVVGLALTVGAVGCKKRPNTITDLPGSKSGMVGGGDHTLDQVSQPPLQPAPPITSGPGTGTEIPTAQPAAPTPTGGGELGPGHQGWPENPDALKGATVYFGFDQATIRSGEHAKLSEVATYLKNNPTAAVRVEGNCDERGTEEYNRSLGERRALAAREALVSMGIEPSRVDTVSYGEDKPAVPGHDEAAFAKNRRDDFIVLTPPGAK